ncbi:MAG TPA: histidine phosphatase family protein [Chitinophagaceae bacterium]|jgi:Phosphohistidine phosphatase SixA
MKQLILIRHAKSSWAMPAMEDIDRPLNDRGKKDAPVMAKRLLEKKINIDAFISSPAKRAKKTARLFTKEFGVDKKEIILSDELYMASTDAFYQVIENTKNKFETIAVFSHNPGITAFANLLTNLRIDNMPTCSVFAVKIAIDKWSDFRQARKEFWLFDYPKAIS